MKKSFNDLVKEVNITDSEYLDATDVNSENESDVKYSVKIYMKKYLKERRLND